MKKFKTIIMLLLVAIALYAQRTPRVTNDFKEGDLIFQVSQSRQSPFIQLATNSPWSHCGVIVEKKDRVTRGRVDRLLVESTRQHENSVSVIPLNL